jgi:hypothetical protein
MDPAADDPAVLEGVADEEPFALFPVGFENGPLGDLLDDAADVRLLPEVGLFGRDLDLIGPLHVTWAAAITAYAEDEPDPGGDGRSVHTHGGFTPGTIIVDRRARTSADRRKITAPRTRGRTGPSRGSSPAPGQNLYLMPTHQVIANIPERR